MQISHFTTTDVDGTGELLQHATLAAAHAHAATLSRGNHSTVDVDVVWTDGDADDTRVARYVDGACLYEWMTEEDLADLADEPDAYDLACDERSYGEDCDDQRGA